MNQDNKNNVVNNNTNNTVNEVINEITGNSNNNESDEQVINVSEIGKDGQNKCPMCGATDITLNTKNGKLKCNFCRHEFDPKGLDNVEDDISKLKGRIRGKGLENIKADSKDVITLKCSSCGAEVVIDTSNANHARCHWCRNILTLNSQIENGAVPDTILPFKLPKEDAQNRINTFVGSRKFFAHPKFKKEFTTENIMGVYFPYMIVDANCHAAFKGQGEHLVRRYTVGSGDNRRTRYDADLYVVSREFDILINDLTIESSSQRLDKSSNEQTNNIINSIMPFDTENCIQYKSNYLIGYTSERRDVNIDDIEEKVNKQLKDVARFAAKEDAKFYDRGIKWEYENLKIHGSQWLAAYLPVWLYSYLEVKGDKKLLHYVAVNARTGETMGSVPINQPLLILISFFVEILGIILTVLFAFADSGDDDNGSFSLLFLLSGFVFYTIMYFRYRNKDARHTYEQETKKQVNNMVQTDEFIEHRKGLSNSTMQGSNESKLEGDNVTENFLNNIIKKAKK